MLTNIACAFGLLFASIFPFTGFTQLIQKENWNLVYEEDGIEVFTRTADSSLVKEIRITLTISSTIEEVSELLGNVPLYTSWVYKCDSSKRLKTVHANEFYYYIVSDFPFPFTDRDLVVHSQQWIDPVTGAYHSHSKASADLLPINRDLVRIDVFESTWDIKPVHGGLLYIDYQAKSSPGGEIPIWLVNLAITKGPIETMLRFVALIDSQKRKKE